MKTAPGPMVVWIVVGWAHSTNPPFAYTPGRWFLTRAAARNELRKCRTKWTGTNWKIMRMVPRTKKGWVKS